MVAFLDHQVLGDNVGKVRVVDREGKLLLSGPEAGSGLAWSAKGDEVWSSTPLVATSLSGRTRTPWNLTGAQDAVYDISRSGSVLFSRNSSRREIVGSAAGGTERNLTWLNWSFPADISRDGRFLLFDEQQIQPNGIYLRRLDGSPAVLLGEGKSFGLSPDGRWALAAAEFGSDTIILLPTGAGQARKISLSGVHCQFAKFLPDGNRILFGGNEPGGRQRLFTVPLSGGKPQAVTPDGSLVYSNPISPDGKLVVAMGPDGRPTIYAIESGEPHPVPGVTGDDFVARWSADGRSLYVVNLAARPGTVDLVDVQTGQRTPWKEFHPPDPAGVIQIGPVVMTADGTSYVYSYRRILDELYVVTGLK